MSSIRTGNISDEWEKEKGNGVIPFPVVLFVQAFFHFVLVDDALDV